MTHPNDFPQTDSIPFLYIYSSAAPPQALFHKSYTSSLQHWSNILLICTMYIHDQTKSCFLLFPSFHSLCDSSQKRKPILLSSFSRATELLSSAYKLARCCRSQRDNKSIQCKEQFHQLGINFHSGGSDCRIVYSGNSNLTTHLNHQC